MQQQNILYKCLLFTYKKKKYIYRLTRGLYLHQPNIIKNIDYIILPSYPYDAQIKSFGYYIDILKIQTNKIVLIKNWSVKKVIQALIDDDQIDIKWQIWKEGDFTQIDLIKNMIKLIQFPQYQSIDLDKLQWYNNSSQIYNFYFPPTGTTTMINHKTNIYLIDPDQQIITLLNNFKIDLFPIKFILITSLTLNKFVGFIELFFVLEKFILTVAEDVYLNIIKKMQKLFKIEERVINKRCNIRVVKQGIQYFQYGIKISYDNNANSSYQLTFPNRQSIKIYSSSLQYYPKQIQTVSNIIIYNVGKSIRQQLHCLPELFRRKIIYNRPIHKYNHKYFYNLTQNNNIITYKMDSLRNYQLNYQDQWNQYGTNKILKDNQNLNVRKRVIKVKSGYVKDQDNQIYKQGMTIINKKILFCMKNATINFINEHQFNMLKSITLQEQLNQLKKEDHLKSIQQNSFIQNLTKKQYKQLNNLLKPRIFEAGQTINIKKQKKVYFIIKGGLKWMGTQIIANKNFYIGNIIPYYQKLQYDGQIQVIKDTWSLQIQIIIFIQSFLENYPQKIIQLFSKGIIFK